MLAFVVAWCVLRAVSCCSLFVGGSCFVFVGHCMLVAVFGDCCLLAVV